MAARTNIRIFIQQLVFSFCAITGYVICFLAMPNPVAAAPEDELLPSLTTMLQAPTAVAVDADEFIYVVESGENSLLIFQPGGAYSKKLSGLDKPISVAVNNLGWIYIGNSGTGSVEIYDVESLQQVGVLGIGAGEFIKPIALAIDSHGAIYVADEKASTVKVFNPDGSHRFSFGEYGTNEGKLQHPTSIVINEVTGEILVLDVAEGMMTAFIQVFTLDGILKRRFAATWGVNGALLFRPLGMALDDTDRIYVSDTYTSQVAIYNSAGNYIGHLNGVDHPLHTPLGMTYSAETSQLFVTSLRSASIEVFTRADIDSIVATAEEKVDSDSDRLPDDYENQYASLDPSDPSDASKDPDQDGFTTLQEYQTNSDPYSATSNPGTLSFSLSNIIVDEETTSVALTVERSGGSVGAVAALCFTTELNATTGNDFSPVSTWLVWADGDSTPKTCTVPLIDDTDLEDAESFQLDLSSPSGGVLLGVLDSLTVTIMDNDGSAVANDFNGDRKSDLLMRNTGSNSWHYYPMDGKEILSGEGEANLMIEPGWQVVGVDDFNGDGKADLLVRNARTHQWYYYPMDGKAILPGEGTVNLPLDSNWQVSGTGDIDGDGKADVLLRHTGTYNWYYYPLDGKEILAGKGEVPISMDPQWTIAGIGDFNGDDKADVLLRHARFHLWDYYPLDGKVVLADKGRVSLMRDPEWKMAGIGDFNGDSNDDVLLRNTTTHQWYYYPMNGRQILANQGLAALPESPDWNVATIGDNNGDGRADVLTRHTHTHQWHYYPMNGREVLNGEGMIDLTADPNWIPVTPLHCCNQKPMGVRRFRSGSRSFTR